MNRFAQAMDEEIAALERDLEKNEIYVKLRELKRVRQLYSGVVASSHVSPQNGPLAKSFLMRNTHVPAGKSVDAVSRVIKILDQHNAPLTTLQLIALLSEQGVVFNSSAPQATLSSLLSRSPEVQTLGGRVGWGLVKWNSAGGDTLRGNAPPADDQPEAEGREAGPGGGT